MVRIARWSSSSRQASSTSCKSEKRRANDVCGTGARDVVLVVTEILFSHVIQLKDLKRHLGVEERMIVKYGVTMARMNFLGVHSGPERSRYIYVDSERAGL
jgi:hypothetical protein